MRRAENSGLKARRNTETERRDPWGKHQVQNKVQTGIDRSRTLLDFRLERCTSQGMPRTAGSQQKLGEWYGAVSP